MMNVLVTLCFGCIVLLWLTVNDYIRFYSDTFQPQRCCLPDRGNGHATGEADGDLCSILSVHHRPMCGALGATGTETLYIRTWVMFKGIPCGFLPKHEPLHARLAVEMRDRLGVPDLNI